MRAIGIEEAVAAIGSVRSWCSVVFFCCLLVQRFNITLFRRGGVGVGANEEIRGPGNTLPVLSVVAKVRMILDMIQPELDAGFPGGSKVIHAFTG